MNPFPALHLSSPVTTTSVSQEAGSATQTTTVGMDLTKGTAISQRHAYLVSFIALTIGVLTYFTSVMGTRTALTDLMRMVV